MTRDADYRSARRFVDSCGAAPRTRCAVAMGEDDAMSASRTELARNRLARHRRCRSSSFAAALALWEALVRLEDIPPYVLPAPSVILAQADRGSRTAVLVAVGDARRSPSRRWRWRRSAACCWRCHRAVEMAGARADCPSPSCLQVTPIIAIAPLLLVYLAAAATRCWSAPFWSPSFRFCRIRRSGSPRSITRCSICSIFIAPRRGSG